MSDFKAEVTELEIIEGQLRTAMQAARFYTDEVERLYKRREWMRKGYRIVSEEERRETSGREEGR
jgi:hypothetical protein